MLGHVHKCVCNMHLPPCTIFVYSSLPPQEIDNVMHNWLIAADNGALDAAQHSALGSRLVGAAKATLEEERAKSAAAAAEAAAVAAVVSPRQQDGDGSQASAATVSALEAENAALKKRIAELLEEIEKLASHDNKAAAQSAQLRGSAWPWRIELARSIPALGASELFFLGAEFLLGGAS